MSLFQNQNRPETDVGPHLLSRALLREREGERERERGREREKEREREKKK